jgi:NitT/TauT family transport system substrate-binding protein
MHSLRLLPRAVLLVGLLAAGCGPATPAPTAGPLRPVRINYAALSGAHASLWYAYEKGLFQKHGVEVTLLQVQGGAAQTLAALLRGEIDLTTGGASAPINAVVAGEERVIVAAFTNDAVFQLVVGPDIQTPQDLIGKNIAVGSLEGFRHKMTLIAFEHLGLNPAQVNFVPFRDTDEPLMAAAIEGGTVSGAMLASPLLSAYRDLGMHVLFDLGEAEDVAYLRLVLSGMRGFVAENRAATLGVLKGLLEAIPLMRADPEGTQAVLAKYTGLDNPEDLAAIYDVFVLHHLQTDLYPSEAAWRYSLELETLTNPDAARLTMADVIDTSLLDEIIASGFMETLPGR